jgi:hypothetical protein
MAGCTASNYEPARDVVRALIWPGALDKALLGLALWGLIVLGAGLGVWLGLRLRRAGPAAWLAASSLLIVEVVILGMMLRLHPLINRTGNLAATAGMAALALVVYLLAWISVEAAQRAVRWERRPEEADGR